MAIDIYVLFTQSNCTLISYESHRKAVQTNLQERSHLLKSIEAWSNTLEILLHQGNPSWHQEHAGSLRIASPDSTLLSLHKPEFSFSKTPRTLVHTVHIFTTKVSRVQRFTPSLDPVSTWTVWSCRPTGAERSVFLQRGGDKGDIHVWGCWLWSDRVLRLVQAVWKKVRRTSYNRDTPIWDDLLRIDEVWRRTMMGM